MANIIVRPDWFIPERRITPEAVFLNRRYFLKQMGIAGAGALSVPLIGCAKEESVPAANAKTNVSGGTVASKYPAKRNPQFNPDWKLTKEEAAASLNNFYE